MNKLLPEVGVEEGYREYVSGIYEGQLKDGIPHGLGKYVAFKGYC